MFTEISIRTLGLLLMGSAFLLIIYSFRREKKHPSDKKLAEFVSKLKRDKKVSMSLDQIGRLSWLKGQTVPYVEDQELTRELYSYPKNSTKRTGGTDQGKGSQKQTHHQAPESPVPAEINYDELPAPVQEFYAHKTETTLAFFEEIVYPLLPRLQENETLELIMKILTFLATKGSVSSVVSDPQQHNAKDISYSYTLLKHVTLEQHSVTTAKIGMELLRKEFLFYFDVTPDKYLVIFLGHDLGKVVSLQNGASYTMHDHPILSARILDGLIPASVPWKQEALEAVKNHHLSINPNEAHDSPELTDLWLLQTADRKARELEIQSAPPAEVLQDTESKPKDDQATQEEASAGTTVEHPTPPTSAPTPELPGDTLVAPSGILPAEVLDKILPVINRLITQEELKDSKLPIPPGTPEGNFLAVSQPDGIVYLRPDVIYHAFTMVVNEKAVQRDNAAILAKPKNEALKDIVTWLGRNKCLPPQHIKPGYYGRWYVIRLGTKDHKVFFTPIVIQAFGVMPSELESKRLEITKIANLTVTRTSRG